MQNGRLDWIVATSEILSIVICDICLLDPRQACKKTADLDSPAVLGEHLEANGRPKDGKHHHENNVNAHLPYVRHQVKHPAVHKCICAVSFRKLLLEFVKI